MLPARLACGFVLVVCWTKRILLKTKPPRRALPRLLSALPFCQLDLKDSYFCGFARRSFCIKIPQKHLDNFDTALRHGNDQSSIRPAATVSIGGGLHLPLCLRQAD